MKQFITTAVALVCLIGSLSSLFGEEWPIAKDVVLYEATVSGKLVKITASERAFDPAAHVTTELSNGGTEDSPNWQGATVDGNKVLGTDQTLPTKGFPQLDELTVYFGDKKVEVPKKLLHNIFSPHLSAKQTSFNSEFASTIISISRDAKCVIIDLGVGDGGGSSNTIFVVSEDGTVKREYPSRPGE